MTPQEFREWEVLWEEFDDPADDDETFWQGLIVRHMQPQVAPDNHVVDYSDAICWAAFWLSLGAVLCAGIVTGVLK